MTIPEPETMSGDGATLAIYRDAPAWEAMKTVAIGAFRCTDAGAGAGLLVRTADRLRDEGFAAIIGPMDGDTWHAYRLITESDGSPPFSIEPQSAPHDFAAFTQAGFAPIETYVSARTTPEEAIGAEAPLPPDFIITAWDGQNAARFLDELFELSLYAFSRNRFYKPIGKDGFLKLYQPFLPVLDPRLVLFARDGGGQLAGFAFGYPNFAEGPNPKTAVFKTYASRVRGGGHVLSDRFHRAARDLGYTHVIHALIHVDNVSRQRSQQHGGHVFRRYALMGRRLEETRL